MADAAELGDRLIGAAIGALELQSIYVGRRLGLYEHLRSSRSVEELAAAAGIHPRYAREWLEQQAVAGLVSIDDGGRFFLDGAQQAVLAEPLDPYHVAPLASATSTQTSSGSTSSPDDPRPSPLPGSWEGRVPGHFAAAPPGR
ncbi:MAG: hypothetical protein ABWY62_02430, partial [Acidimicrobiia bacterium]